MEPGLIVTSVECVGDITATEEASELSTTGHMHRMRIAGGLLGDGEHGCDKLELECFERIRWGRESALS